jgi:hypothetical protein
MVFTGMVNGDFFVGDCGWGKENSVNLFLKKPNK